jgi:hypothetical protein
MTLVSLSPGPVGPGKDSDDDARTCVARTHHGGGAVSAPLPPDARAPGARSPESAAERLRALGQEHSAWLRRWRSEGAGAQVGLVLLAPGRALDLPPVPVDNLHLGSGPRCALCGFKEGRELNQRTIYTRGMAEKRRKKTPRAPEGNLTPVGS